MEYFLNFDKIAYLRGPRPEGCILCLIRDGDERVARLVVRETASFSASVNLYPYNPGHLILFPKRHVTDLRQLSRDERAELDALVDDCLSALDATHRPAGYNLGYNMGLVAGASIEHLHLHVIPRYPREIGIAELVAGKRVLVEDPFETERRLRAWFDARDGAGAQDGKSEAP
ncbi:MAG: HIT domain-containing protein [Spirochaetia bacterium]|nr:HIT domain-containing protein [Spirochaetia bacterium]